MTPEDRDLLLALRQQQAELQKTLERLNVQLDALESRIAAAPEVVLPPLPADVHLPPIPIVPVDEIVFPPIPSHPAAPDLPPIPTHATPPLPPKPEPETPFHWHLGRWLTRIGALSFVLFIVSFATYFKLYERIGAGGKIGLMGLFSMIAVILGQRFERKKIGRLFFARTLLFAGLAGLYATLFSAHYFPSLSIITSSLFASVLLVVWSLYVFYLAERRNSQLLGVFSVTLAYVSTALNPDGTFTLLVNLVLAATSVVFLLRMGWTALPTFSVIGTYFAVFRRLIVDDDGTLVLDTSRTLPFWPYAIYLYAAWFIFTLALIITVAPSFRGSKRIAFLSLNNAAFAGLLALTAYISGYGASSVGWTLLDTGFVFLVASRFVGFAEIDPVEVMSVFAAQGLALVTAGIVVLFTGITRALVLMFETFLLGVAGAFAGDRVLTVATYIAGFLATLFAIWEMAVYAHHPWLLGFGGALIMLINAWNCRSEVRDSREERTATVVSTSCYCILALALILTALCTQLNDSTLPPALALAALALTFIIYQFSLYELPPLAQILQLIALSLVLFPAETGVDLPWWTTAWVGLITLILVTWWSRQRTTRTGSWKYPLKFVYAFALVDITSQALKPWFDAQGWMVMAAFLSVAYLIYGAFLRVWSVAAVGQFFLALSVYHFFFPPSSEVFPWSLLAAAVPVVVVFVTAQAALEWLRLFTEIQDPWRKVFRFAAYGYYVIALLGLARWVFGIIPASDQVAVLLFLGTLILSINVRHRHAFGVRCSFFLSALGMWLYFATFHEQAQFMATPVNALAMLLFLAQPALLRHEGKSLVTPFEYWALIIFSVGTGWLFVSVWFWTRFNPGYLTLAWTLYALFLFLFGLIISESRFRACGIAILVAAILRVFGYDFWGFSSGYRVLTLLVLAIAAFGIGFFLLRRDHRNTL